MRAAWTLFLLVAIALGCESRERSDNEATSTTTREDIVVYFSPDGGVTDAIVREIEQAERTLDIAAFSFTSPPIATAVRDAHRRGVVVRRVILDRGQESHSYSSATFLDNAGIPVHIRVGAGNQHSKYMILDEQTVITGSFNFTRRAEERNSENVLILYRPELAEHFTANFNKMLDNSRAYERKYAE